MTSRRCLKKGHCRELLITPSEYDLRRKLNQPWRRCFDYLPKRRTVEVAIDGGRAEELSMIERIERLQSELKLFGLGKSESFQQRHIEIEESRSVEEAA